MIVIVEVLVAYDETCLAFVFLSNKPASAMFLGSYVKIIVVGMFNMNR